MNDGMPTTAELNAETDPDVDPRHPDATVPGGLRRCIGSAKFGIEAHDAPIEDFPKQPSRKDGLGRMCKPHWTEYTRALRRADAVTKLVKATDVVEAAVAATELARLPVAKAKPGRKAGTKATASRKAVQAAADAEYNETTRREAQASTPDFEALADADPILVDRKARVKAWRRQELESPKPGYIAPGASTDAVEA